MELLSVYIHSHDYLFENPEFLNFGGAFYFKYSITIEKKIKIEKKQNKQYIPNLFNPKITNISAIVGNNGSGKTSFLKILNRTTSYPFILIYKDDNEFFIENKSDLKLEINFDYKDFSRDNDLYPLYYSSLIDFDLKIHSHINQTDYIVNDNLANYYYDNIVRQVFFLNKKSESLKKKFKEFPFYKNLNISITDISKEDFINNDFFKKSTIGKNILKELDILWSHYDISKNKTLRIEGNFIKSFEVFMLSLLVSDDTYAVTNANGNTINFKDVLQKETFKEKLEEFLKKRIDNIDNPIYLELSSLFDINFENKENIIEIIEKHRFSSINGQDFKSIKTHLIQTIIRYSRIFELYVFTTSKASEFLNLNNSNQLTLSISAVETKNYLDDFIKLYLAVYESLQYITFDYRIFNVLPEKKLSTGEQSLLNFFSSIHNFVLKKEHHLRNHKQYLLLLDEPETGYHAVWKKKFISSINTILPELFKELKKQPNIQIIFTTHDALTLSDIPNYGITYLKNQENNKVKVFNFSDEERPSKSFGANITDLLADSFFVDDGLIGDFSKDKIQEVIIWLNNEKRDPLKKEFYEKIINIIDEPIIQRKLSEMYDKIFNSDFELKIIDKQIRELEKSRAKFNKNDISKS